MYIFLSNILRRYSVKKYFAQQSMKNDVRHKMSPSDSKCFVDKCDSETSRQSLKIGTSQQNKQWICKWPHISPHLKLAFLYGLINRNLLQITSIQTYFN